MMKVGMNMEIKVGLIGPSVSNSASEGNPGGAYIKGGVKFLLGSQYVTHGMKHAHPLFGSYFKPEIIYSRFDKNVAVTSGSYPYYQPTMQRATISNYAINLVYGKQSIVGNILTIDWYFGMGYGGQSMSVHHATAAGVDRATDFEPYCFSHSYGGPDFPLVFSAGLAIGILVK
jgi:hypothetical protein